MVPPRQPPRIAALRCSRTSRANCIASRLHGLVLACFAVVLVIGLRGRAFAAPHRTASWIAIGPHCTKASSSGLRGFVARAAATGDYAGMTVVLLKKELSERGLPVSGTKPVLIKRLEDNDAVLEASGETDTGGNAAEESGDEDGTVEDEEDEAEDAEEGGEEEDDADAEKKRAADAEKKRAEADAVPGIQKGDWIEALPGQMWEEHNAIYYDEGHKGVVTYCNGSEGILQVTWNISQLVTQFPSDDWDDVFHVIEKDWPEEEEDEEELPYGRRKWGDDNDWIGLGPGSPSWNPDGVQFFVGDMVEARRPRDGNWVTARCAKNHGNFTYNVKWDSDAIEEKREYEEIRKPRSPETTPMPGWVEDWWPME